MLIHVDGLLGLVGLNEFLLCLLKSVLIFEVKSKLKMNFGKLILSMRISQSECLVELFLIGLKVDSSLNQAILEEELSALLGSHVLSDLNCDLC